MKPEEAVQEVNELSRRLSTDKILLGIITLLFFGVVIYIIRAFLIKSLARKKNIDTQRKVLFVKIVTTILWILAVAIVIGGHGMQTSSLLALMGLAGLALSLSLQGLLSNFFSGCVLPITKPFREGDIVEICGNTGFIEYIGYFNTTLVTIDNVTIIIANSALTSGNITNYTAKETLRVERTFTVVASTPDEDVRTAIREAIEKDPHILTDPEPFIHLDSFDSMNATYVVSVPCKSREYYDAYYSLVENVRTSFEEHSIEMGSEMFGMHGMGNNGSHGGAGGSRGGAGQQGGGAGGSRGEAGQQGGGAGGSRGGAGQQGGGAGGSRGGAGQQGGGAGGSRGEAGQQGGGAGQQGGGAGGNRGGAGQQGGGAGGNRGGAGQ